VAQIVAILRSFRRLLVLPQRSEADHWQYFARDLHANRLWRRLLECHPGQGREQIDPDRRGAPLRHCIRRGEMSRIDQLDRSTERHHGPNQSSDIFGGVGLEEVDIRSRTDVTMDADRIPADKHILDAVRVQRTNEIKEVRRERVAT
jgi:hypothetical protein